MGSKNSVVALGIFDGVHLGHRCILEKTISKTASGLKPVVFTFKSSSLTTKHGKDFKYIYTDGQKEMLLSKIGINEIISENFNDICNLSGEEFVSEFLVKKMSAACVVCGNDYRFGKNAEYGAEKLSELCSPYSIEVIRISDVNMDGEKISSQQIRELLSYGAVNTVNELLGRRYFIMQDVEQGNRIGRTIGFPTINQKFAEGQLIPKLGVYATNVTIDGEEYKGVTNIGKKPTISDNNEIVAETHILGFEGDLYGRTVEVCFENFMRSEIKFASVEDLKARIRSDIQHRLTI